MTRARWLGIGLIVIGIAVVLLAPRLQSCVAGFGGTPCDASATIILKVVGVAVVAIAAIVLALPGGSAQGSGDDTR